MEDETRETGRHLLVRLRPMDFILYVTVCDRKSLKGFRLGSDF